jgi:hypothetical protein
MPVILVNKVHPVNQDVHLGGGGEKRGAKGFRVADKKNQFQLWSKNALKIRRSNVT